MTGTPSPAPDPDHCLRLTEAARRLNTDIPHLLLLCHQGAITTKPGGDGTRYVSRASVNELLNAQTRWTPYEITRCRQQAHLTRTQLARLIGVTPATITTWEQGHKTPTHTNLTRLHAQLRNIPPEETDDEEIRSTQRP